MREVISSTLSYGMAKPTGQVANPVVGVQVPEVVGPKEA